MTRREMARLLGWALLPPTMRRANAEDVNKEQRYRADAQVLVLSLPIYRRSGVGGGSVLWREWQQPAGMMRQLEFTGYSNPERAAGLNRMGFIREKSCRDGGAIREASYFGVMTASPEETAADAHKALHSTATEVAYTAIQGHIAGVQVDTATAHFMGPARLSAERRAELIERAERELSGSSMKGPEFRTNGSVPPPFLHALATALVAQAGESRYIYSGRLYRLWLRRSADSKAAAYFRERKIIQAGSNVVRVAGKVRREAGGKETEFRLWIEEGAAQPVPLRIDFQPKAYLRLVFEADA